MKDKLIVIIIAIAVFTTVAVYKLISLRHIEDEYIEETPVTEVIELYEREITLYFPDNNLMHLIKKKEAIISDGVLLNDITKAFDRLKNGYPDLTISSIIPKETLLLSHYISDRTLFLNLNHNVLVRRGSSEELLFAKSIVFTFVDSFPTIDKVHFLVENNIVRTLAPSLDYGGHLDFRRPFLKSSF